LQLIALAAAIIEAQTGNKMTHLYFSELCFFEAGETESDDYDESEAESAQDELLSEEKEPRGEEKEPRAAEE